MPKKIDKYDRKHRENLSLYEREIEKLYRQIIAQAAQIGISLSDFKPDKLFSFGDYPAIKKRVDKLFQTLQDELYTIVLNGINAEWTLANNKNSELARQVFGDNVGKLSQEQYRRYFSNNGSAREAFTKRKVNGLNLSDRVWRYTEQFKAEIELGLDVGIRNGLSADEMSQELRQYLKFPDRLFRRVRDEHGNLVLSKRAAAFHPGRGVYRSSYKNARRLAATETNMSYMTADYERWQQLDFIVGIRIVLSNNHTLNGQPFHDICDELSAPLGSDNTSGRGCYPKDFKFTGWHPLCRCHVVSILKTDEEIAEDTRRILAGEPLDGKSVNRVDDVPQEFKQWLKDNEERAKYHSSVPYFIKDNPKYIPESFIKNMGTLKRGKDSGVLHDLKEAFFKLKDPSYIKDKEVQQTIMDFAANNSGLFFGGLTAVQITRAKGVDFFMANTRSYLNSTGSYNMKGNTIKIANKDFILASGETFNPLEEVKGALKSISTGAELTFNQEYALESLWHEIRHAAAVGWKDLRNKTELKSRSMETINQFCARHSYSNFVKSLGGKATNAKAIIERGYGYRSWVTNFQKLLGHMGVTQSEANAYFKDIILKTPYEDIYDEIVRFVQKKGKYSSNVASGIVKKMVRKDTETFGKVLNTL